MAKDIRLEPYAAWLEGVLSQLADLEPQSIAIIALLPEGHSATTYYECGSRDRFLMVQALLRDNLEDWIRSNAETIAEIVNGEADEDEEDEE